MSALAAAPDIPIDRVEWRVDGKPTGEGSKARCRFVPYLDARDIAELLDQWVGPANWRDAYEAITIDGKFGLLCHLSVRDPETGEWVTKTDVGVPSNFEGQKGAVSDAFKRAGCLKWGVGRNVYELPTLWAPCRTYTQGGKVQAAPNDRSLPDIHRQLKAMGIEASGGRVADTEPESTSDPEPEPDESPVATVSAEQATDWLALMNAIEDKDIRAGVKSRFKREFGVPDEVPAGSESVVEAWLTAEIARVTGPIDTRLTDEERAAQEAALLDTSEF